MKKIITPPQSTPIFDAQEKISGFDWLTGFVNRLILNRVWYLFFSYLGAAAASPQIIIGTLTTSALPAQGVNPAFFFDPTYDHWFYWNGTSWAFADGGSEYIVRGAPTGGLWAPCDGGTYSFAQTDGSLVSKASEDLRAGTGAEPIFPVSGAAVGSRVAASAPSYLAASPKTNGQSNHHTHSVNTGGDGSVEVQSGTGTSFESGSASPHLVNTSDESADHTHALGTDAALNPPSVAKGGLPLYKVNAYFQRR